MVKFDSTNHTYLNIVTNRPYVSVSKLLSLYKEPFNKDFFAAKTAIKEGVSKDEIIKRWDETNKVACDKGQTVHDIIEDYIKKDIVADEKLITSLNEVFDKKQYKRVLSEEMVWNDAFEIAGTSDTICDVDNNLFDVYDFKTNKKFEFYNRYGKYLKLPLNNLQQCQYNDYSLQLSLYAYMYSHLTDKKVRKICILYYNEGVFYSYPVPYLFWEVSALLKHYIANYGQATIK
jgi:hypothetical protein